MRRSRYSCRGRLLILTRLPKLCKRHRDLELGLADASIVVLCRKWNTRGVATFDERDFRSLEPLQGGSFELLPADSGQTSAVRFPRWLSLPWGHEVRIGIVGAGRIGGNAARQALKGGHEVTLSFSRDPAKLDELAAELGERASAVASAREAVASSELVVFSVPWGVIPQALEEAGDFGGRIVVDTTNQFGSGPMPVEGQTAAAFNAARMAGARYVKSLNTLTSAFQEETASRTGDQRVVQWICGDDADAKQTVAALIEDMGYVPVDLGGTATCAVMEAPRRPGAVYGEEYRAADAEAVVEAVRSGRPIPPTPSYG